jgi:hypothetical protein
MIQRLTDRFNAIVATNTVSGDRVMVEVGRYPRRCRMAVIAAVAAGDMVGRFTIDDRIIVAARTFTINLRVIDLGDRRKTHRAMAILAKTRRRNVSDTSAGCSDAIVAARATGIDSEMIEKHREPTGGPVAAIALLLCRWMVWRLADALHIIVTTRATAKDCVVIHFDERKPLAGPVAILAEICA